MQRIGKSDGSNSPRNLTESFLMEQHVQERKSLAEIARECGCTRQFVYLKMKELGVPLMSGQRAPRIITMEDQKPGRGRQRNAGPEAGRSSRPRVDGDFFRTWTPAMTYVLGVLCTSGAITAGRLSIQHAEAELLEKVLALMNCPSRILRSPQRSYGRTDHRHAVHMEDDAICRDLRALGMAPTRALQGFPAVPTDMTRHFVRGCWDTAGSVAMHGQQLRVSFASGSRSFISGLVELLYDIGIHRDRLLRTSSSLQDLKMMRAEYPAGQYPLNISVGLRANTPSYAIRMDAQPHVQRLFYYLYAGVDESMFLRRTYDVFVQGLGVSEERQHWLRAYHEDLNLPPTPPIPVTNHADTPDPAA